MEEISMNKIIIDDVTKIAHDVDSTRFNGKKILLTGAVGFLGTYFTHYFLNLNDLKILNKKCHLICLDNFSRGVPPWLNKLKNRNDITILEKERLNQQLY